MTDGHTLDNLQKLYSGKVRNIYDYGRDKLLIFTTDRISAFDFVFEDEIKGKGSILNQMAIFWFNKTKHIFNNHLINCELDIEKKYHKQSMIVKKTKVVPIEAIVRGHIAGSAWDEYLAKETIHGTKVKSGLNEYDKLDKPMFTPSTKSDQDKNISEEEMVNLIGADLTDSIKSASLKLYEFAYEYALNKGIIIADTKFEFGICDNNTLTLIDEIFTPDCSRFLRFSKEGKIENAFDKQFFRDFLKKQNWNRSQITIPKDIKEQIIERYEIVYKQIVK
tara:strand:- start:364 stop:1197 length:834 start_codon:yes stop_codon:yes gene_type:complete